MADAGAPAAAAARPIDSTDPAAAAARLASLDAVFRPKSIAVIGASKRPGAIGREIVHNLISGDFHGKLFPVNPNADYIHSIKAYPSILEIPDPVDLAIIVVPAALVGRVVDECGRKGVKGLVIITAGFREIGSEGAAREAELLATCRKYGMRAVGPNCLGVFNAEPAVSLNATFAPGVPLCGPVGFVSQSGALGIAIWTEMQKRNVGFSQFVSIGNKIDITGNDLIEYWENDSLTKIIALYIEDLGTPERFTKLARQISRSKPILMVKSGRTKAGARAASSHTGALSGLDAATDALLRQVGVIRARTIDEMMALLLGFSRCPLPKGRRVAVLTNAGGPGIMATDALVGHGMELAEISAKTQKRLASKLPAEASVSNPIDMIASADTDSFRDCLEILLKADEVDIAIVAFVPPIMVDPMRVVRAVTETMHHAGKPVYMVLMAEEQYYDRIPREIPECPPIYRYPETAALAATEMANHAAWIERDGGSIPVIHADREEAQRLLNETAVPGEYLDAVHALRLLETYGFPLAPWRWVGTAEEAVGAADALGYPVALKVAGRKVVHKSDVGGVILDILNRLEMEGAVGSMTRSLRKLGHDPEESGFLVQKMMTPGREVILGMNRDPVIGPVLLFGMGGKYVEVFRDVALRVHPITDVEAREMVESIRGYPLLEGVRGDAPVALPVIHDALLRLSAMITDLDRFAEIDLNPFLMAPEADACRIVDARIRIRE
jgi:acetyl coenzyme A synthetase (ADP forming)-like protein